MDNKAQLTLSAYVVLIVVFIFILVCLSWFVPLIGDIVATNSAYSTGNLSYMAWLLPVVILAGGIVMFFMPNTVVR